MTTSQKAALSLLIAVLLFGAFTALVYTGLFELLEARFYNPSITNSLTADITRNAETIDNFLNELKERFSAVLKEPAVKQSFLPDQQAQDIYERSRIYGLLLESVGGLQWVRFIDSGGFRIHFSTSNSDIMQQDNRSVSYRNYSNEKFPYELIATPDNGMPKYTFDEESDSILFSFPFYDSFEVYRGTALFSLSVRAISEMLIREGQIKVGQDISIISNPQGFLSGTSTAIEKALAPGVSSIWLEENMANTKLNSPEANISLVLITVKTPQGFYVGRLIGEDMFSFPSAMKTILLASFFITVYLIIFLLFNIKQDSVTIVQNRLKNLQISLIEQYYERKGEVDWNRWSRELEQRREEISSHLKRGIKTGSGEKKKDIDVLVDKSWDELITVIGGRKDTTIDEDKMQVILNRILAALPGTTAAQGSTQAGGTAPVKDIEVLEELGEAEPSGEAETEAAQNVEELEELEEIEALEELREAEASGEAETAQNVEEIEAVEELAEAEAAQNVEELEELEEIEAAEEPEEAEAAQIVEELNELETEAPVQMDESEVQIIDMAEMNLPPDIINEVVNNFEMAEEIMELEELEEIEGETQEEKQTAAKPSAEIDSGDSSQMNIDSMASQIEFSPSIVPESGEEASLNDDFEIVSPFATMLIDFSNPDNEEIKITIRKEGAEEDYSEEIVEKIPDAIEEIEFLSAAEEEEKQEIENDPENIAMEAELTEDIGASNNFSLIYKPFMEVRNANSFEPLDKLPGQSEEMEEVIDVLEEVPDGDSNDIIEEREGIHYIKKDILDSEININEDFKDLVDSVIK